MKTLFQIFIIAFIFAIIGCSEKENNDINNEKLIATWHEKINIEGIDKYAIVEYVFDEDGDYEVVRKVFNSDTDELLGYRFMEVGKYFLKNDQLTFHIQETYVNDDSKGLYSDAEDLVLSEQDSGSEFTLTIKFENGAKTLVYFYPPCPPDANCIDRSVFNRG